MNIYFYTFGCKVNQYETELIRQRLEERGHKPVGKIAEAQVCVINSCTVTAQSDLKMRQLIHKIRRENPAAVIALLGCHPQVFGDDCGCDIVLGNSDKLRLPEILEDYLAGERRVFISPQTSDYAGEILQKDGKKTRGIIKVQDGCDLFCSYCIIPYARGRSRSKPISDIEAEAKILSEGGQKELVIVGINLSDYGKGTGSDLSDAVSAAAKYAVRVRLGSIEPENLSEEIIEKLSKIPNLCPHFHLALQSGCDKTLREMHRRYDKEKYFTIVSTLREHFPDCAITTDIMVGFPGESDDDFKESLETVKAISFADAHIFPYSKRSGTNAAKREDQVPESVKSEREKIMQKAVSESALRYSESLVGKELEVLFEREKSPDFHQGHSAEYQVVKVKRFTDSLYRELRKVRITEVSDGSLIGETVN